MIMKKKNTKKGYLFNSLREAAKKSSFFDGRAIKALPPPPPLSFIAFGKIKKKFFFP